MSTPIRLGSDLELKFKFKNGRALAYVVQHGKMVGRLAAALFAPLTNLDHLTDSRRLGLHVLRRTVAKQYQDSPEQRETKLILARWDGRTFFHISPTQVGREGAAIDLEPANAKFELVLLPDGITRFLRSYPNAPQKPVRVLADLKLDEHLALLVTDEDGKVSAMIRDSRLLRAPSGDVHCGITAWHSLLTSPELAGSYLARVTHGTTTYCMVQWNGSGYQWPGQIPACAAPGATVEWAGLTEECSKLLRDILA